MSSKSRKTSAGVARPILPKRNVTVNKETDKLALDARLLEEELSKLRDQIAKDAEKKNSIPKMGIWRSAKNRVASAGSKKPTEPPMTTNKLATDTASFVKTAPSPVQHFDLYSGEMNVEPSTQRLNQTLFRHISPLNMESNPPSQTVITYKTVSSRPISTPSTAPTFEIKPFNNEFEELVPSSTDSNGTPIQVGKEKGGTLWGTFNENAESMSFQEAVHSWRKSENINKESDRPKTPVIKVQYQPNPSQQGGLLWGRYDEVENRKQFEEAVMNWRNSGSNNKNSSDTQEMEIQTADRAKTKFNDQFVQNLKQCTRLTYFDRLEHSI